MNAPATTPTTETTTPASEESALVRYMKSLDPKAKPNASDKKSAASKFKAFQQKKAALLDELKKLETEETEVSLEALRAFGRVKLTVDGTDYVPTCREERIYYKSMSLKGIVI